MKAKYVGYRKIPDIFYPLQTITGQLGMTEYNLTEIVDYILHEYNIDHSHLNTPAGLYNGKPIVASSKKVDVPWDNKRQSFDCKQMVNAINEIIDEGIYKKHFVFYQALTMTKNNWIILRYALVKK